jgi:hypothetical protein
MSFLKYLKYLGIVGQVIATIEAAKSGTAPIEVRGIRVSGETWDFVGVAQRRED